MQPSKCGACNAELARGAFTCASCGAAVAPTPAAAWPPKPAPEAAWPPKPAPAAAWPPKPAPEAAWPPAAPGAAPAAGPLAAPASSTPSAFGEEPPAGDPRFGPPALDDVPLELDWSNRRARPAAPVEPPPLDAAPPPSSAPAPRGAYGVRPLDDGPNSIAHVASVMEALDVPEWKQEALVFVAEAIAFAALVSLYALKEPISPLALIVGGLVVTGFLFAGARMFHWASPHGFLGWVIMAFTLGVWTCVLGAFVGYVNRLLFQLTPKLYRPLPLVVAGSGVAILALLSEAAGPDPVREEPVYVDPAYETPEPPDDGDWD